MSFLTSNGKIYKVVKTLVVMDYLEKAKELKGVLGIIKKHNEVVVDFCEDHSEDNEEKVIAYDLNSLLDKIVDKIADFGYGETNFHTADIELMYKIIKIFPKRAKELLEEVKKGCGKDSANSYQSIACICDEYLLCNDCQEAIKICEEILK